MPSLPDSSQHWQLVVSDLDGTLLDQSGRLPARNVDAVRFLHDIGIGFTIATGRIDRMTRDIVRRLDITLPVIACNGAVIRDCRTDRILAQDDLPPIVVMALVHEMIGLKLDFLCYTADQIYYPASSKRIELVRHYNQAYARQPEDLIELLSLEDEAEQLTRKGIVKILVFTPDPGTDQKTSDLLRFYPGLEWVRSSDELLEIMVAGTNKGTGLARLADIAGVSLSQVIAFGDHENDKEMLAAAGLGIAMGNATSGPRAASSLITETNADDGFAAAIDHLFIRS